MLGMDSDVIRLETSAGFELTIPRILSNFVGFLSNVSMLILFFLLPAGSDDDNEYRIPIPVGGGPR